MYKIIGADGREYGPVSAEVIRQWISEGRANLQSRVQTEGSTVWQTLAELPEFAAPASAEPPVMPKPANGAADKKIAAGICGIILGGLGVHKFILGYTGTGLAMLLISVFTCFIGYPVMHVIGIVEGIIYLTKSDDEFVATYVTGKKGWF